MPVTIGFQGVPKGDAHQMVETVGPIGWEGCWGGLWPKTLHLSPLLEKWRAPGPTPIFTATPVLSPEAHLGEH